MYGILSLLSILIPTIIIAQVTSVSNLIATEGKLKKLLAHPKAQEQYQKCIAAEINQKSDDMGKCIWDGNEEKGIPSLDEATKKQLQDMLSEGNNKYEGIDISTATSTQTSALKKLEDYFRKKLQEVLKKDQGGKIVNISQRKFNKIYESQLGKNIISSLSSYCIEANEGNYKIPESRKTREKNRQNNLKRLSEVSSKQEEVVNTAYAHWSKCILAIQHICYKEAKYKISVSDYQQRRACEVTNYLKAAKQNLIALNQIERGYKQYEKNKAGPSLINAVNADNIRSDKITNMTSNELINKSDYKKEVEKMQQQLSSCKESPDDENCKKLLSEKDYKLIDEYSLRSRAIASKLKSQVTGDNTDKKAVEEYLKEEGYSTQKISQLSEEKIREIKQTIQNRYDAEREALIKSMKAKMDKTSISSDDPKIANNKLRELEEEVSKEAERYKELVYFNNIISGYLSFEDSKGKVIGKNTKILQQELADSAFDPKNMREDVSRSITSEDYQNVKKQNENQIKSSPSDSNNDETGISVDQINQHLLNIIPKEENK